MKYLYIALTLLILPFFQSTQSKIDLTNNTDRTIAFTPFTNDLSKGVREESLVPKQTITIEDDIAEISIHKIK